MEGFFDLPEFTNIRKLFIRGQQGLLVRGNDQKKISELIKEVYNSFGIERLILFLKTLEAFANTEDYELLSSLGFANSITTADTERINKVMNFSMENYTREIKMEEITDLVNLNESSFCRYFKSRTHKTFSRFLNEIRIANACKLLINSNMTISEVCYKTGYNNISYFTRQFKLITNLTAREYAKKYLKSADR